jgi:hypothetical protein
MTILVGHYHRYDGTLLRRAARRKSTDDDAVRNAAAVRSNRRTASLDPTIP